MCVLNKIFHVRGSDLEYVSQMCNITPLEIEIANRQRKFRKKFDLAGETVVGVVFVSASVYFFKCVFYCIYFFCACVCVHLCCLHDELKFIYSKDNSVPTV